MGRGYQRQGHRPSSGLIHALHQGWVRRGVCLCVPCEAQGGGVRVAKTCSGGGAAVDREEVNDGESKRGTATDCMGRGYLGQGHRPSSGLIHALHQGVGALRCVCVSHTRHRQVQI